MDNTVGKTRQQTISSPCNDHSYIGNYIAYATPYSMEMDRYDLNSHYNPKNEM